MRKDSSNGWNSNSMRYASLCFVLLTISKLLGTLRLFSCRKQWRHPTMFIKSLQIGFVGLFFCVVGASAGAANIQGIVKDAKGQPIKGAEIRIESRNGAQLFQIVKTDVSGRYLSDDLEAGVYRVTLAVHGTVKASIMNTKTIAGRITELNFDLKPVSAAQATTQKPGKHIIWMPAMTGSHVGGGWAEVDEND